MPHSNRELWASFIAIIFITLIYLFAMSENNGIPAASGFFGHGLGIVGFVLMLMTETLYSWRKRSPSARWGRMSSWLRFHIFSGLVGPYMVLLHSSWKFNGLAGIVMLLTVVIVLSGIIGRYIYTAVPRTADGVVIEASELDRQIAAVEGRLQEWRASQPEMTHTFSQVIRDDSSTSGGSTLTVFGRALSDVGYRFIFWRAKRKFQSRYRTQTAELEQLFKRKRILKRQVSSLIMTRRLLSFWHAVHIPIGVALFATAFIHMIGTLYYATLLR
jgi:hypothetical protein